ncbi:hypothetical protein EHQ46_05930 [Leptospira yanagawae]|uniref:Uncharacterized protein n=1 Tax=Leptospira yanagawae TaxID=293069 RepID=A0ABY2M3H1_9LEPT|nr:hypothetical protein [Leptospira yanagawae]TGL23054.1 hypothetical protein EHQ46_05930 [Leptospira yanagawae]
MKILKIQASKLFNNNSANRLLLSMIKFLRKILISVYRMKKSNLLHLLFSSFLCFVCFSCIAQAKPDPSLTLLMPWEYGDQLYPQSPVEDTALTSNNYVSALTSNDPLIKGYVINWLLFTPPETNDETQNEIKIAELDESRAIKVDATKPIKLPLNPSETLALRDVVRRENEKKEIIKQDSAQPDVYHARIFISSPLEIYYLKELLIPNSPLPLFNEPSLNYSPSPDELVGHVDFSEYREGAFVYVVLTGYHYNFIIQNNLFQAVQIISKIEYDDLALINFDLSMSTDQLNAYIDNLMKEADSLKKSNPEFSASLDRFHHLEKNYQFAIFGPLGNSIARLFSSAWNSVRNAVIRATANLGDKLKIDPSRLNLPESLRDRLKFDPETFFRNAFTIPDWIKDKLKPPQWLTDQLNITKYENISGIIEILDKQGAKLRFNRQDRKLTLDFTPITLRLGPDLGPLNGINPMNVSTFTLGNGIFHQKVMSKFMGAELKYHVCFELNNGISSITDNVIFNKTICNGAFKPGEFHFIEVKNAHALTAAMVQFSHRESIEKLGVIPKKARILQGGVSFAQATGIASAPCGQIANLALPYQIALLGEIGIGSFVVNSSLMGYDIYLHQNDDFLTVVHEYSHIVHCSIVGDVKYRAQIEEYAKDIIALRNPRNSSYGMFHEGVANYIEFILNSSMNYCIGCRNIEENIHGGFLNREHLLGSFYLYTPAYASYDIFTPLLTSSRANEYSLVNIFLGDENLISTNRTVAISSLFYDLEDSCGEPFPLLTDMPRKVVLRDRISAGRNTVLSMIRDMHYPASLINFPARFGQYGINVNDYFELVNMHGLNELAGGSEEDFAIDPFLRNDQSFVITLLRGEHSEYNDCLLKTKDHINQNLNFYRNISNMFGKNEYRFERTNIIEINTDENIADVKNRFLPPDVIAPRWIKESSNLEKNEYANSVTFLNSGEYLMSPLEWKSTFGIAFEEFKTRILPSDSTFLLWTPIGKETKEMGSVRYSKDHTLTSPVLDHYEFTDKIPEQQVHNIPLYPDFVNRVAPLGCKNNRWLPIGKQPQIMGLECWTAVGAFMGIPLYEDHCTQNVIEIDERGNVQKHPLSINSHFVHLYNLRRGNMVCELEVPEYSEVIEFDSFHSFTIPQGAYNKQWIFRYFQKNGSIQFLNSSTIDSFRSSTLNFDYFNSTNKERGYFEYFIKNE